MSLQKTYEVEKSKWDELAQKKPSATKITPLEPEVDFYSFSKESSTHIGVVDFLGDLNGKHVLEYGCGLGQISVLLAKTGAKVTTFDLSANSVSVTRKRSEVNELDDQIDLAVAAGESLPFADESFDVIFGKAILHHLNIEQGWPDLFRLLKKGGRAVFIEPMGMNPLLRFARARVPYPGKNPRGADRPLNYDEIKGWGKGFNKFDYKEIQLLGMLKRGLGVNKNIKTLNKMDDYLLEKFPALRRHCRYVVMYMEK